MTNDIATMLRQTLQSVQTMLEAPAHLRRLDYIRAMLTEALAEVYQVDGEENDLKFWMAVSYERVRYLEEALIAIVNLSPASEATNIAQQVLTRLEHDRRRFES